MMALVTITRHIADKNINKSNNNTRSPSQCWCRCDDNGNWNARADVAVNADVDANVGGQRVECDTKKERVPEMWKYSKNQTTSVTQTTLLNTYKFQPLWYVSNVTDEFAFWLCSCLCFALLAMTMMNSCPLVRPQQARPCFIAKRKNKFRKKEIRKSYI